MIAENPTSREAQKTHSSPTKLHTRIALTDQEIDDALEALTLRQVAIRAELTIKPMGNLDTWHRLGRVQDMITKLSMARVRQSQAIPVDSTEPSGV